MLWVGGTAAVWERNAASGGADLFCVMCVAECGALRESQIGRIVCERPLSIWDMCVLLRGCCAAVLSMVCIKCESTVHACNEAHNWLRGGTLVTRHETRLEFD